MSNLQKTLTLKEARRHFDSLPSNKGVVLTCTAENINGPYFYDFTSNPIYNGARHLPSALTAAKTRFYMDTLQKVLGRVPAQQKFIFDLLPDISGTPNPRDYSWLSAIMTQFNGSPSKPRVNLGILEWFADQSVTAIAQFSFRDAADAVRFKLTYC